MSKENDCNRKKFMVKGAAALLSVMLILPAMPMTVYAKEDVYEVQKGDCLWKIAEKYLGDGARYADIVAWNEESIEDPNLIYPGMTLRVALGETPVGPYENGTISGTTWENEWLDMRLELPAGFNFADLQDYNILDAEESSFEFIVVNPSYPGMTMIMAAIPLDIDMDEVTDDLLDLLEQQLSLFGVEGVEWKSETVKLGGMSFQHYYTEAEYMNIPIYPEYYMAQKEDIIAYLQLFYMDYDGGNGAVHSDMKALMNGFH